MKQHNAVRKLAVVALTALAVPCQATLVSLQSATATYSQTLGSQFVSQSIDGTTAGTGGWAIYPNVSVSQTAAVETAVGSFSGFGGRPVKLTFTLYQNFTPAGPFHELLKDFRLSYTTADRSAFADGNQGTITAGDVGSSGIWTTLAPTSALSLQGLTLTPQPDNSLVVSGTAPFTDTYTITAIVPAVDVTGFRLEAIGPNPGFESGNFVLTELTVDGQAVPEPSTVLLLGLGGTLVWRQRKHSQAWRRE